MLAYLGNGGEQVGERVKRRAWFGYPLSNKNNPQDFQNFQELCCCIKVKKKGVNFFQFRPWFNFMLKKPLKFQSILVKFLRRNTVYILGLSAYCLLCQTSLYVLIYGPFGLPSVNSMLDFYPRPVSQPGGKEINYGCIR